MIRLKRIHAEADESDGRRVLIDRLWPRGISKEKAALDSWAKEAAPSNELRKWFHDGGTPEEFEARYRMELESADLTELASAALEGTLTLLTAVKEPERSHASVLRDVLEGR